MTHQQFFKVHFSNATKLLEYARGKPFLHKHNCICKLFILTFLLSQHNYSDHLDFQLFLKGKLEIVRYSKKVYLYNYDNQQLLFYLDPVSFLSLFSITQFNELYTKYLYRMWLDRKPRF